MNDENVFCFFPRTGTVTTVTRSSALVLSLHNGGFLSLFQNYAFPDVLECCLVLSYTDQHFGGVPRRHRERASALLLTYATSGSPYKARQRFSLGIHGST